MENWADSVDAEDRAAHGDVPKEQREPRNSRRYKQSRENPSQEKNTGSNSSRDNSPRKVDQNSSAMKSIKVIQHDRDDYERQWQTQQKNFKSNNNPSPSREASNSHSEGYNRRRDDRNRLSADEVDKWGHEEWEKMQNEHPRDRGGRGRGNGRGGRDNYRRDDRDGYRERDGHRDRDGGSGRGRGRRESDDFVSVRVTVNSSGERRIESVEPDGRASSRARDAHHNGDERGGHPRRKASYPEVEQLTISVTGDSQRVVSQGPPVRERKKVQEQAIYTPPRGKYSNSPQQQTKTEEKVDSKEGAKKEEAKEQKSEKKDKPKKGDSKEQKEKREVKEDKDEKKGEKTEAEKGNAKKGRGKPRGQRDRSQKKEGEDTEKPDSNQKWKQKEVPKSKESEEKETAAEASESEGEAEERVDDSEKGLLLVLKIEVEKDKSEELRVHDGDDALELAKQFCAKHNMNEKLAEVIAQQISENVQRVKSKIAQQSTPDSK